MSEILAGDIMSRDVISVGPGDEIEKVIRILLENRISGLPVVDEDGKVIGIISEGDLIAREKNLKGPAFTGILGGIIYLESPKRFEEELKKTIALKVSELMSKKVHAVDEKTSLNDIATMMIEKGINRVPVLDNNNKIIGIITRHDILKATSVK